MRLLRRDGSAAPSLPDRAEADLRFIRGAMERSGSFSAVPGIGAVAMGGIALVAAGAAQIVDGADARLAVWGGAALAASVVGAVSMVRKAVRQGVSLLQGPGRRFLLCLCPALFVGSLLTAALARAGQVGLLPAAWLLCYGAGVTAAGAFSVPVVPLTGASFLALGAAALVAPASWGDLLMALGFGVVHIVSGVVVARRHGG
jgi:hypothetical protein